MSFHSRLSVALLEHKLTPDDFPIWIKNAQNRKIYIEKPEKFPIEDCKITILSTRKGKRFQEVVS